MTEIILRHFYIFIHLRAGSVTIDGHDILQEPLEAKRLIGYLPEQPPLYASETPREHLKIVGEAKGLRGAGLQHEIEQVIERTVRCLPVILTP